MFFGGWGVVGWSRKSYLGSTEIASFSSQDLSRRNKHDSFLLVVSTGYFFVLFLWAIVFSDFLPLEIYKHLVCPLPSITFTAKSQADNHFYKYVLFVSNIIQYEISFLLKYALKYFIFTFDLSVKHSPYFL